MKLKKEVKAQVTTFVILAIIVLILVGLYFAVKEYQTRNEPSIPDKETKETTLIKEFVENCLSEVSKNAIILSGEQGGYVNIPSSLNIHPLAYRSEVYYNSIYSLPYWYYFTEENIFSIKNKPALCSGTTECGLIDFGDISVQEGIENYVYNNIDSCLNNFKEFEEKFEIKEIEDKDIKINIFKDKVIVNMNYPLSIKIEENNDLVKIESYSIEHDVNLLQMFDLAMTLTEAESSYHFIEDNTMNLISAYAGLDEEALPPIAEISFVDFTPKFWIKREVEDKMRYDVLPFIGLTKISNTLNSNPAIAHVEEEYYSFTQGFYNSFVEDIGLEEVVPYEVEIYYPDSEIMFYIDGGEEVIRPKSIEGVNDYMKNFFQFAIQEYTYDYNLAFPVIITITDDSAFNNEGYSFSFAVEANIRNNIALHQNMTFYRYEAPTRIRINDPNVLVNKTITVEVKDEHTGNPVIDAMVIYNCGNNFYVGETEMQNNKAIFTGKLPYCGTGGYLKITKKGYASAFKDYNNDETALASETFIMGLWPEHNKSLTFYKRTKEDIENMQTIEDKLTYKHELSEKDELMFSINKIKDDPREDAFPLTSFILVTSPNITSIIYNYDSQIDEIKQLYNLGEINRSMYDSLISQIESYDIEDEIETQSEYNIELVPGTYGVSMTLITKGPFNIPEKTEEICLGTEIEIIGCVGDIEEVTYNAINLSSWVTGEYSFNVTLYENRIYNAGDLKFFVPFLDAPETWDELEGFNLKNYVADIDSWKLIPYYE